MAGALSAALLLAACGGTEDEGDTGDDTAEEPEDDAAADDEAEGAEGDEESAAPVGEGETVTIGWMPWEEAIAVTNLWDVILSDNGFEVEQQQLDPGIVFEGISTGDLDLFFDAWLPNTHSNYMDQYGEEVDDLGPWLEEAPLTWVVPSYVEDINSIEDLQDNADMFDGQIIGIEAGAGLTDISINEVLPAYGLEDDYEVVTSSTPAMLSELETAIENEEPIVVTLWRPHPAYGQFDLKDLEDPEVALGEPDQIHTISRTGFADDYPEVAAAIGNFEFGHEALSDLEVQVLEEEGQELEAARAWLEENMDVVEPWLEGTDLTL